MSKAFDSISNNILLAKFEDVGVSSSCLTWFRSYLSERYQAVRINSTLSEKLPVVSGVPQGSILGPLLFSVYVNDLPSATKTCSSESYVDDTKLLLSFHINDSNAGLVDLNENLIRIRNWCFDNLLLLNQIDGLRKSSNACKATLNLDHYSVKN
jgi:sarcosine oxidase/L-pipecolate oxidase